MATDHQRATTRSGTASPGWGSGPCNHVGSPGPAPQHREEEGGQVGDGCLCWVMGGGAVWSPRQKLGFQVKEGVFVFHGHCTK